MYVKIMKRLQKLNSLQKNKNFYSLVFEIKKLIYLRC